MKKKKVPDEWQALQVIPMNLRESSSKTMQGKHNNSKQPVSTITAIFPPCVRLLNYTKCGSAWYIVRERERETKTEVTSP